MTSAEGKRLFTLMEARSPDQPQPRTMMRDITGFAKKLRVKPILILT
jgi:hypothetical protein